MTARPVVSNSSPLIAFTQLGQLDLLRQLFPEILVPSAVLQETARSVPRTPWLVEHALAQPPDPGSPIAALDIGEAEAISLAMALEARYVILDDRRARRVGAQLELPVIGTLGVFRLARRRYLIEDVRPLVEQLRSARFHLSPALSAQVIAELDEST